MEENLKGKNSFVIVAYAMPLEDGVEDPRAGVLKKLMEERDLGMVTGIENLMAITALGDHRDIEASINSVLMGLDSRVRVEIHNFADHYIDQWRDQWPHQQRPWWWAGRHLEELHLKEEEPIKPTKALMMRVSAGAYLQPVSSQEEAQGLPDPAMKGVSMLMTFNEGQDLDDVSWAAEKTFWLLKAELARYFFSPLKGVLGEGRVATLLKKYGKEVKG